MLSISLTSDCPHQEIPLYTEAIHAGFPSPAADHTDRSLDFNTLLIHRRAATYCLRVTGESMIDAGILPDDILVVDRSLRPAEHDIIVASIHGEFTVKEYMRRLDRVILHPCNPDFNDISIAPDDDFQVFGVVTAVVRQYKRS